jgi:hypothetical protein
MTVGLKHIEASLTLSFSFFIKSLALSILLTQYQSIDADAFYEHRLMKGAKKEKTKKTKSKAPALAPRLLLLAPVLSHVSLYQPTPSLLTVLLSATKT